MVSLSESHLVSLIASLKAKSQVQVFSFLKVSLLCLIVTWDNESIKMTILREMVFTVKPLEASIFLSENRGIVVFN